MILIPELQIILIFFFCGKTPDSGEFVLKDEGVAEKPGAPGLFIPVNAKICRGRGLWSQGKPPLKLRPAPDFFFCPAENKDRKRKDAGRPGLFTGVSPLKKFKPGKIHRFLRISGME